MDQPASGGTSGKLGSTFREFWGNLDQKLHQLEARMSNVEGHVQQMSQPQPVSAQVGTKLHQLEQGMTALQAQVQALSLQAGQVQGMPPEVVQQIADLQAQLLQVERQIPTHGSVEEFVTEMVRDKLGDLVAKEVIPHFDQKMKGLPLAHQWEEWGQNLMAQFSDVKSRLATLEGSSPQKMVSTQGDAPHSPPPHALPWGSSKLPSNVPQSVPIHSTVSLPPSALPPLPSRTEGTKGSWKRPPTLAVLEGQGEGFGSRGVHTKPASLVSVHGARKTPWEMKGGATEGKQARPHAADAAPPRRANLGSSPEVCQWG